ncbi:MAG: helix-turn-helix domain-containing protein [Armatimonadota bacterium]
MSTVSVQTENTGLLEMKQACQYLHISDYLLRKLVRQRRIPCLQLGRAYYFRKQALDNFVADEERASISQGETPSLPLLTDPSTIPQAEPATSPQAEPATSPQAQPATDQTGIRAVVQ